MFSKHCPGCFRRKSGEAVCPHCGYDESLPRSPLFLPHGTVVGGRYRLGRVLCEPDRTGILYLGWDVIAHVRVAIKEYLPSDIAWRRPEQLDVSVQPGDDQRRGFSAGLEQFLRGAEILASIQHPSLLHLHRSFRANDTAYWAMDFHEGRLLQAYLSEVRTRLEPPVALAILRSLAQALGAVHERGLLHRNLRPANILLATAGRAIAFDFDVREAAEPACAFAAGQGGYAAPEQCEPGAAQGVWTDIYGLAASLHGAVLGRAPPAPADRRVDDPLTQREHWDGLPEPLCDLLRRGLALEPDQRPRDTSALIEAIDALGLDLPDLTTEVRAMAVAPGRDDTAPPRIRPPEVAPVVVEEPESLRWWLSLLAIGSVALSIWAIYFARPEPADPTAPVPLSAAERELLPPMLDLPPMDGAPGTPLRISRTEVTVEQFRLFVERSRYVNPAWKDFPCTGAGGPETSWDRPGYQQADTFPVVCVSAADAQAYAAWVARENGRVTRLPTEAEWEFAARGGSRSAYWWGEAFDGRYAACAGCDNRWPSKPGFVAAREPNAYGLVDTAGNVREWTCSPFTHGVDAGTGCAPRIDEAVNLVVRGGSWQEPIDALRSDYRQPFGAYHRNVWTGFRVVDEPPAATP